MEGEDGLAAEVTKASEKLEKVSNEANEKIEKTNEDIKNATTTEEAVKAYDDAVAVVEAANKEYAEKEKAYDEAKKAYDEKKAEVNSALDAYNSALKAAKNGNDEAKKDLENANTDLENAKNALADLETQVNAAKSAAEEAKTNAISAANNAVNENATAAQNAKSDFCGISTILLKDENKPWWNERDKVFKEIVEGYFVSNVLAPGATNVKLIKASEINDPDRRANDTSEYFIHHDKSDENYAVVSYDIIENGVTVTKTAYLNYDMENVKLNTLTIFEKTPAERNGKTVYLNDDYRNNGVKLLNESDESYQAWLNSAYTDEIKGLIEASKSAKNTANEKEAILQQAITDDNNARDDAETAASNLENAKKADDDATTALNSLNKQLSDARKENETSAKLDAETKTQELEEAKVDFAIKQAELMVAYSIDAANLYINEANQNNTVPSVKDLRAKAADVARSMIKYYIVSKNPGLDIGDINLWSGYKKDYDVENYVYVEYKVIIDGVETKKRESYYFDYDKYDVKDKLNDQNLVRDMDTSKIKIYSANGLHKESTVNKDDVLLTYSDIADSISDYDSELKELIEAKKTAEEKFSINEAAKSNYAGAKLGTLKATNFTQWTDRDNVFKEIVEGYYVKNVLDSNATNIKVIAAADINDSNSNSKSTYFIKFKDDSKNYAVVSYETKNEKGEKVTCYAYLNYKVDGNNNLIIFEKTLLEDGVTYSNAKYDEYKKDSSKSDKIFTESNNTSYASWLESSKAEGMSALEESVKSAKLTKENTAKALNDAITADSLAKQTASDAASALISARSKYNQAKSDSDLAAKAVTNAKKALAEARETTYGEALNKYTLAVNNRTSVITESNDEITAKNAMYDQLALAKKRLESAEEKVSGISQAITKLNDTIDKLLSDGNADIISLLSRLNSLNIQLENAEKSKNTAKDNIDNIKKKIDDLTKKLDEKKSELAENEKDNTSNQPTNKTDTIINVPTLPVDKEVAQDTPVNEPVVNETTFVTATTTEPDEESEDVESNGTVLGEALSTEDTTIISYEGTALTPSLLSLPSSLMGGTTQGVAGVRSEADHGSIVNRNVAMTEDSTNKTTPKFDTKATNKNNSNTQEIVTIKDEPLPLSNPLEDKKTGMSWWWAIAIAALGISSVGWGVTNKKKEERVTTSNSKED